MQSRTLAGDSKLAANRHSELWQAALGDDLYSQPAQALVRHCPKCGSVRVHRSRRKGMLDAGLDALGADILRCHDCRARQAWFGLTPLRLRGAQGDGPALTGIILFATGSVACVLLIWWMISRFTDLSG